jgi:hypothetical protein
MSTPRDARSGAACHAARYLEIDRYASRGERRAALTWS